MRCNEVGRCGRNRVECEVTHYVANPTLPYPTLRYSSTPYPTLSYPSTPCPTLLYPTVYPALPYPLPYPTLYPTLYPDLPCPTPPCPLPYPTLSIHTLPCPLPYPTLPYPGLPYLFTTTRHEATAAMDAETVTMECKSGAFSACLERSRLPPAVSVYVRSGLRECQSDGLSIW